MNRNGVKLDHYIGREQLMVMRCNCRGEEGEYFQAMMRDLKTTIAAMPTTYASDGQGDAALARLHYFSPSSDWWITERDAGGPDDKDPGMQDQAFGFACLNGDSENAELGYISIAELIRCGVELDLYYEPSTIGEIKEKLAK